MPRRRSEFSSVRTWVLERLGLTSGTVSRGDHALMFSARRGFDDHEWHRLAASLDAIYDDFVAKVAQGRGRTVAEIEAVARGRVWTGSDAVEAGLVDRLGGFLDAVQIARSKAGLPEKAPVRPAVRVGVVARLRRPRNSTDPRASVGSTVPKLTDLAAGMWPTSATVLLMPTVEVV